MMEVIEKALFVPRNQNGGYNCSVLIERLGNSCRVHLLPGPNKMGKEGDESHFMDLVEVDDRGQKEFYVGNVLVRLYPLEFSRDYAVLTFDEAVKFMTGLPDFKRK